MRCPQIPSFLRLPPARRPHRGPTRSLLSRTTERLRSSTGPRNPAGAARPRLLNQHRSNRHGSNQHRVLRWLCSIALLAAFAPAAAACSNNAAAAPGVTGAFGADPDITMPNGNPPTGLQVTTLLQGSGAQVTGDDFVLMYVEGKVWAGNRLVYDSFTNREPQGVPLSTGGLLPAWTHLVGQRVGSRVMMIVPPKDGFGSAGDSSLNILGGDTLVFVFDLLSAVSETSVGQGAPVAYHPAADMPAVSVSGDAAPKITVPSKDTPPASLVVSTLVKGSGPTVLTNQTVVVQDSGVVWRSGVIFQSSWQQKYPDAFVIGQNEVIPGWEQAIGGATVGSSLLVTIPPALAYGDQAEPPDIEDNDTLVFVIDIIAAYTPQTT
ncbi:MAG TPA: FKBP-type peptidyl-prolyl cis-trans isomerase [Actinocrinis sp.]|jgi:peptidylprolyl isomerase